MTSEVSLNFRAVLDEAGEGALNLSTTYLRRVGDQAKRAARSITKREVGKRWPRRRSGPAYIDSFRVSTRRTANSIELTLTNDADSARFVERGAGPHTIAPREAPRLAWPASRSSSGQAFVGQPGASVNHPGAPARRILERSLRSAAQKQRSVVRGG